MANTCACIRSPLRVVCIGDSITLALGLGNTYNGYVNNLQLQSTNIEVTNMGVSFATIADITNMTTSSAQTIANFTIKPNVIIVELGSNDLYYGDDSAAVESNYQSMLTTMLASDFADGSGKIYCLGVMPRMGYSKAAADVYSNAIQAAVEAVGCSDVTYAPTYSWLDQPDDFQPDGIRPNKGGCIKMADDIMDLIEGG